jgi:hypothetical protein
MYVGCFKVCGGTRSHCVSGGRHGHGLIMGKMYISYLCNLATAMY